MIPHAKQSEFRGFAIESFTEMRIAFGCDINVVAGANICSSSTAD